MEEFQSTTRFLEQCWQLLTTDGWLVINFHQLPEFDHTYMERMCRPVSRSTMLSQQIAGIMWLCVESKTLAQSLSEYRDSLAELEQRFDIRLYTNFARIFKLSTPVTDSVRLNSRSGLESR